MAAPPEHYYAAEQHQDPAHFHDNNYYTVNQPTPTNQPQPLGETITAQQSHEVVPEKPPPVEVVVVPTEYANPLDRLIVSNYIDVLFKIINVTAALVFGAWAIRSFQEAQQGNILSANSLSSAQTALSVAQDANVLALFQICEANAISDNKKQSLCFPLLSSITSADALVRQLSSDFSASLATHRETGSTSTVTVTVTPSGTSTGTGSPTTSRTTTSGITFSSTSRGTSSATSAGTSGPTPTPGSTGSGGPSINLSLGAEIGIIVGAVVFVVCIVVGVLICVGRRKRRHIEKI